MISPELVSGVIFWGMRSNANKTKTMIVSRPHTMHSQSPTLTLDEAVLEESVDLDILRLGLLMH